MASPAATSLGRRLRLAVGGAVVVMALTVATAGASAPGVQAQAWQAPQAGLDTSPRTPVPGFLLDRGRFLKFDAPQAGIETGPNSIDNRGRIVGSTVDADADATYHGFRRDTRGRFTTIDLPGAKATVASRINDRGQIVGRYYQTTPFSGPDARFRGFLLDHGRLTRIDVPGAAQTQAVGVNNLGRVVGEYQNPDGTYHGFVWHKGRYVTVDLPGAAGTSPVAINDRGQIAGSYVDTAGGFHGFLLDRGRFITIDAPGGAFTFVRDLNDRGQIAGFTLDDPVTLAGARGFLLAKGAKGPVTPIDVPGAPRNLVRGLNDRGQLVGSYENTTATPTPQDGRVQPRATMPNMPRAR